MTEYIQDLVTQQLASAVTKLALRVTPIRKDTTEDACGRLTPPTAEHRKCVESTAKELSKRTPGMYSAQELIDNAEQLCTFNEKAKLQGQRREEEIERLLREKQ